MGKSEIAGCDNLEIPTSECHSRKEHDDARIKKCPFAEVQNECGFLAVYRGFCC
jgi:hypothetical protein